MDKICWLDRLPDMKNIMCMDCIIHSMSGKESNSEDLTFYDMVLESAEEVDLTELYKSNKGL
jgi:hypothetical protein